MKGQSLCRRPVLVVVAHPANQFPVGLQVPEAVREALAHRQIKAPDPLLHEVVHGERCHAIGLQGDRPEAAVDQLREQFVADPRERGFQMRRLSERENVT
ncbi:hypothetical protein JOE46_003370 [Rhodococcus sp. PvR099]|nr:hypothetical protein [Rhodococcus sp. PvR099]